MPIRVTGPPSSSLAIRTEAGAFLVEAKNNRTPFRAEEIMLRMLLVAVLGLSLAVVVQGDDTKPRTDPLPPWQRLLTGADARKAAELEKRIGELEYADRYLDVIQALDELLALRTN